MVATLRFFPILCASIILSFLAGHWWIPGKDSGQSGWVIIPVMAAAGFVIMWVISLFELD